MQKNKYVYLFPFEKIPPRAKILLYGAGLVGQEYLRQLETTGYCDVVGILDRAYEKCSPLKVRIYPSDQALTIEHDFIVLAFNNTAYAADARATLLRMGIEDKKIIYVGQRAEVDISLPSAISSSIQAQTFAFERSRCAIALKYPSSLGDAIQRKALFAEITKLFPDCLIDIYATNTTFIHAIYRDQPDLNAIIEDGGTIYHKYKTKYLLAMEVRFTLLLDNINYNIAKQLGDIYEKHLRIIQESIQAYDLPLVPLTQNRIQCERAIYNGWNCYSFYNYIPIFNIQTSSVSIPLDSAMKNEFDLMQFTLYITFNYGNGATSQGNKNINSRQWPKEHLIAWMRLFKARWPEIKLIQVGDENAEYIEAADDYVLGKNIELVKYVLKNAIFHLDSEGGLMHLATQLGTKCVALFGPTQVELFGYEQNVNLTAGSCHGCYCLYNNPFICARGLEKPECMWSITPEMVMERVEEYLEKLLR